MAFLLGLAASESWGRLIIGPEPTLDERVREAELIVLGTFSKETYEVKLAADSIGWQKLRGSFPHGYFQTYRRVAAKETWKGARVSKDTLWLSTGELAWRDSTGRVRGGTTWAGAPSFRAGERYVLFLSPGRGPHAGRWVCGYWMHVHKGEVRRKPLRTFKNEVKAAVRRIGQSGADVGP